MKKSSILNLKRLLLVVFVSLLFFSAFTMHASAREARVAVDPPSVTINQIGENATVTINVINVTNLFTWQIRLYFNSTILRFDAAWYPPDNVFAGKSNVPVEALVGSDENGTYVDFGCTLIFVEDAFNGSGPLCQMNFTGIAEGSSNLTFGWLGVKTFLLDPDLLDITFDVTGGYITVIPEFSTFAAMSLFIVITLVATVIAKRRLSNKRYTSISPRKKSG